MDLNDDDQPDLLWHHQATGELYVWFLERRHGVRGLVPHTVPLRRHPLADRPRRYERGQVLNCAQVRTGTIQDLTPMTT